MTNTKELFDFLFHRFTDLEYVLFSWSASDGISNGFKFIQCKTFGSPDPSMSLPAGWDDGIAKKLDECTFWDDLNVEAPCNGRDWSEGLLLISLRPIDRYLDFEVHVVGQDDIQLVADKGFKGVWMAGKNHIEIEGQKVFSP